MKHLQPSININTGGMFNGLLNKISLYCQTQPSAVGDTYQHLPIRKDGYVMVQIILSKLETTFDIDQLDVSLSL